MDPNTLNLDPDPGFLPKSVPVPDPDPGLYFPYQLLEKKFKIILEKNIIFFRHIVFFLNL